MRRFRTGLVVCSLAAAALSVWAGPVGAAKAEAKAKIVAASGAAVGVAHLDQEGGAVAFKVSIDGLPGFDGVGPAGFHGFHVHRNDTGAANGCSPTSGDVRSTWFTDADGHYNPGSATHGSHAGDLPVLLVDANGDGESRFLTTAFTVDDVIGRALIVHELADNYGRIPVGGGASDYTANSASATTLTQNTGNAGNRIACGVIEAA